MNIKLGYLMFFLSIAYVTNAYSDTFITRNYEFKPGEPLLLNNPVWWKINIRCTITTQDEEDLLSGTMTKNSASINGLELKQGESTSILVKNNDSMFIVSESGAQVQITNYGQSLVKAKCII